MSLLILIIPVLAIVFQVMRLQAEQVVKIGYGVTTLAILWILWPLITRSPMETILPLITYLIYGAWMMVQNVGGYLAQGDFQANSTLRYLINTKQHEKNFSVYRKYISAALIIFSKLYY